MLDQVDLSVSLGDKKKYQKKLKKLQLRMVLLQRKIIEARRAVLIVYEGWDAAGKGGNIRRLTERLDPRGLDVHPIGAPTAAEKAHHYLRRFWVRLPSRGRIAIFDRSHYGRVLVERVEGFATPEQWQRAYREINEFERQLTDDGTIILKFWLHISKEEQLKRFQERESNPYKKWKITGEDWRNRGKWDQYYDAVEEMLRMTSTPNAPWHIVPGNCKKYARVFTLKTICKAIEKETGADEQTSLSPQGEEEEMFVP